MSNNKQGSVEWFISQLEEKGDAWENVSIRRVNISIDVSEYMELKTKAKAMHKEEMKQTYFDGWHRNIGNRDEDFEQYYNETYGGNNEQQ